MKKMDINKRNEQIYRLRKDGATFRHIGSLFNITGWRACQIYHRLKYRKEHFDSWPPLKKMLSFRSQNGLRDYFKSESILRNPKKIAETGGRELLKIRNVGAKTIKEIASALHNLGYIKDVNSWLNNPPPKKTQ